MTMTRRSSVFFLLLMTFAVLPPNVWAHSYKMDEIAVGHIWAPPPEAGATEVSVFGAIVNRGEKALRLVAVSSSIADKGTFLTKAGPEGKAIDGISIEPGKPHAMAPWRAHIVLTGLHRVLKHEDMFDLTLEFDDGRKLTVEVVVEPKGGHG